MILNVLTIHAQTRTLDSLAVRVLLDENGLDTVSVAAVTHSDSENRIISLDLSGRKILKLSAEIGSITRLKSLVLNNNLLDSLPPELWRLSYLVTLDLSNNHLGHLDSKISGLKNLLFLSVRGNGLTSLPLSLFDLQQLENLLLSKNLLDTLPEEVSNLLFLKYLNVSENQLRTIPLNVAAMAQLDSLDLSGNLITTLPELISELQNTKVNLRDNQLCNLSSTLQAWANQKDPAWMVSQACGLRIWNKTGLGRRPGRPSAQVSIHDVLGRLVFKRP